MKHLQLLQQLARLELSEQQAKNLVPELSVLQDWAGFLRQAELYAISGLILKHVRQHDLPIPSGSLLALKALGLRHRAAAGARYLLMQDLCAAFATNDIPFIALKGFALAPVIYPEVGLRPMRDIDILVPRHKEQLAATTLRQIGFDLPEEQPTKFMRDSHQLPNATKKVKGFIISVEIHHDALSRDVPDSLFYEQVFSLTQIVKWRELEFDMLGHEQMLHQVTRHLEGLHPGAVLKLINVMDVVLYSEQFIDEIDWRLIKNKYSHVINALKCLHLIHPLSEKLQTTINGKQLAQSELSGVGSIMQPLSQIFSKRRSYSEQFSLLFAPSDWWLHLYYNVDPDRSLWWVKFLRHPFTIIIWLGKRLFSRILGG